MNRLKATDSPLGLVNALPDRVYGLLKQRIIRCVLAPGERLNEKEIADELRVSRTPLREALNRLGQERLVVRTPYAGYVVAPITEDGVRDLCELRLVLEVETAGLAAERATPQELRRMEAAAGLEYRPGDRETYGDYLASNLVFHLELARGSHNERLTGMVMGVLDELQRPLYLGLDVGLDSNAATAEHEELLAAVRAKEPERAREIHRRQLALAGERMVEAMRSLGAASPVVASGH
jgi:GntR family transcriptional regulator, rspAB operon transcriptional repressor